MITLFTTTKGFVGRNSVNQMNALRSWAAANVETEILVMGQCEGIDRVTRELAIRHLVDVETSSAGVPLIASLFETASQYASHDICCFVNADIILPQAFFDTVLKVHAQQQTGYLLVGQRDDVTVDETLEFDGEWESRFTVKYGQQLAEHAPYGSDYFVFPRGQYSDGHIPHLLVGRPGWDLWMIYDARCRDFKTIDLSQTVKVIHQNHDYSHKKCQHDHIDDDPEAQANLINLPTGSEFLFTLLACDYAYANGTLVRNYARGDYRQHVKIVRALGHRVLGKDQLRAGLQRLRRAV